MAGHQVFYVRFRRRCKARITPAQSFRAVRDRHQLCYPIVLDINVALPAARYTMFPAASIVASSLGRVRATFDMGLAINANSYGLLVA